MKASQCGNERQESMPEGKWVERMRGKNPYKLFLLRKRFYQTIIVCEKVFRSIEAVKKEIVMLDVTDGSIEHGVVSNKVNVSNDLGMINVDEIFRDSCNVIRDGCDVDIGVGVGEIVAQMRRNELLLMLDSATPLSGAGYFSVKKSVVTSIIGAATTYIVVLVQFNLSEQSSN